MSYLDRIREANRYNPADYRLFRIAGENVGHVQHGFAESLKRWPGVFVVDEHSVSLAGDLDEESIDSAARTRAVGAVLRELHREGAIRNWFDEPFPVNRRFDDPPLMLMERAALPRFGVGGYGVHMNGFVRKRDTIELWIARRARDKPTYPGQLDHLVAGGQPHGISVEDNLIKECREEAGIPSSLAATARPAGEMRYVVDLGDGLRPDTLFVFDLELPEDYRPVNIDGEVDAFHLWPLDQVARRLRDTREFKFNSALVIIHFLLRTGFIPKDHPEFAEIVAMLGTGGAPPSACSIR